MQEHMTEHEAEEYGLYYKETLALYQRYRNDPFELLAAALGLTMSLTHCIIKP